MCKHTATHQNTNRVKTIGRLKSREPPWQRPWPRYFHAARNAADGSDDCPCRGSRSIDAAPRRDADEQGARPHRATAINTQPAHNMQNGEFARAARACGSRCWPNCVIPRGENDDLKNESCHHALYALITYLGN
jgi:hypothetical protein